MEFCFGTVGNTSVHHAARGPWQGPWSQSYLPMDERLNIPLCAPGKRLSRGIKTPVPARMCGFCRDIMQAEEVQVAGEALQEAHVPVEVARRELLVDHAAQRPLQKPPWPKTWGEFSWAKFNLVPPLLYDRPEGQRVCSVHGQDCPYTWYPEARYHVGLGQHKTFKAGLEYGPDQKMRARLVIGAHSLEELARNYLTTDRDTREPKRLAVAPIALQAGDPVTVAVYQIIEGTWGWEIGTSGAAGRTAAIATSLAIGTKPGGLGALENIWEAITKAWGRQEQGGQDKLTVAALARIYLRAESAAISMPRMVQVLRSRTVPAWHHDCTGSPGSTMPAKLANFIMDRYNNKLSTNYVHMPVFR